MKLSEYGARVRDTIEEYGWITGDYGNAHTGFCLIGAADCVLGQSLDGCHDVPQRQHINNTHSRWNWALYDTIRDIDPTQTAGIAEYNDTVLVDKQDALNLVDKVVAKLEEQGL